MKKPDSVARRLSQASGQEKPVKPIEITDIARRRVMHHAYIAHDAVIRRDRIGPEKRPQIKTVSAKTVDLR